MEYSFIFIYLYIFIYFGSWVIPGFAHGSLPMVLGGQSVLMEMKPHNGVLHFTLLLI